MNRSQWERSLLPCHETLGWWLCGFTDGEGCFSISPTAKKGYIYSDEVAVLRAAADEIERLREQVNSSRLGRERAEGLPEGTLPRV